MSVRSRLLSCRYSAMLSFSCTTAPTTEIYTLSLHDALPISCHQPRGRGHYRPRGLPRQAQQGERKIRSEEHTSELQSPYDLVCRLLLEKKKIKNSLNRHGQSRQIVASTR